MSLLRLPYDVLEAIIKLIILDPGGGYWSKSLRYQDLAALRLTHRLLSALTTPFFFRTFPRTKGLNFDKFVQCTLLNPQNTQHIRSLEAHNGEIFQLSRLLCLAPPVGLRELDMIDCSGAQNLRELLKGLNSLGCNTPIESIRLDGEDISITQIEEGLHSEFIKCLSTFGTFAALTRLEVTLFGQIKPQEVVHNLHCPGLTTLSMKTSTEDWIFSFSDENRIRLPHLKSIALAGLCKETFGLIEDPEMLWNMCHNLMKHDILSRLEVSQNHRRPYFYPWNDLLEIIFKYAARLGIDPSPTVKWLLLGWRLVRGYCRNWDILDLEINDVPCDQRNVILNSIKNWRHSLESIRISLYKNDATLALPKFLREIEFRIDERVSPVLTPRICASLPALKVVYISTDFSCAEDEKPLFTVNPLIIPQRIHALRRYTGIEFWLTWSRKEEISWQLQDEKIYRSGVIDDGENSHWLVEIQSWFYEWECYMYVIINGF